MNCESHISRAHFCSRSTPQEDFRHPCFRSSRQLISWCYRLRRSMAEPRQSSATNGFNNGGVNRGSVARHQKKGLGQRLVAWVNAKIFVYNVTLGLAMLDQWERVLFNILVALLLWFVCYKSSEFLLQSAQQLGWK